MLPLFAVVLALGAAATWQVAKVSDRNMRAQLLTEAGMIGKAVDARRLSTLSGSDADLANPDYRRIKEQLMRVRAANPACRFIYLTGRRQDGTIFFYADSEPSASKDYSPPGQVYGEVPAAFTRVFATGQSSTVGPYSDRWGTWVSALVPLPDSGSNSPTAVIAMDMDAQGWLRVIAGRCVAPISVSLFVLLLLSVSVLAHDRAALENRRLAASSALLRESREKLKGIVENIGIGVALISPRLEILELNRQMRSWFPAATPGHGLLCHAHINSPPRTKPCALCPTVRTLQDGRVHEAVIEKNAGAHRRRYRVVSSPILDSEGQVTAAIEMTEDITERLELEAQLRQQQKLESIGSLARGMAHEINNPLSGIMGYAELIKDGMHDQATLAEYAGMILTESRRVSRMTHSLLSYTQQAETQEMAPATPSELVSSLLAQAVKAVGLRGITLTSDTPPDLPATTCRFDAIVRVVMTLIANAMESFGEGKLDPGSLTEATKTNRVSARRLGKDGRSWLRLTVEDNGPGIPGTIRDRVFDPFFTTKDRTRHAGLGLWISQSIVHEHGGELTFESNIGKGTRVHVDLPVTDSV
jgi:signal transduction histidine kinase